MRRKPQIFTQIEAQDVPVDAGILEVLEQQEIRESTLRRYVRHIIFEAIQDVVTGKKMIFMAGAPGSGKSTVLKQLGLIPQFTVVNPDDWYEPFLMDAGISLDIGNFTQRYFDIMSALKAGEEAGLDVSELQAQRAELRPTMSQNAKLFSTARRLSKEKAAELSAEGKDFIIDGTGGNYNEISKLEKVYQDMEYNTAMVYVSVPMETSLERNRRRGEQGGRTLHGYAVKKSWAGVNKNLQPYQDLFGDNFFFVDNSGTFEDYKNNIEQIRQAIGRFLS